MDYEEKREIKRQISQLLADAGINQQTLKEMVKEEIKNKVTRGVEQSINEISNSWCDGFKGYVRARVDTLLGGYDMKHTLRDIVKEAVKDRIIKVVFDKDVIVEE